MCRAFCYLLQRSNSISCEEWRAKKNAWPCYQTTSPPGKWDYSLRKFCTWIVSNDHWEKRGCSRKTLLRSSSLLRIRNAAALYSFRLTIWVVFPWHPPPQFETPREKSFDDQTSCIKAKNHEEWFYDGSKERTTAPVPHHPHGPQRNRLLPWVC